jgi:hypothetical protein
MNGRTTMTGLARLTLLWTLTLGGAAAQAEVFYAGDTKGLPNEFVELTVNARAGTVLEGLDIVPDYDAVSSVLHLVTFTPTPAWTDGGLGACAPNNVTPTACVFFYDDPGKSFAADTVLATVRFQIDPGAAPGVVPFDPGVVANADSLPLVGTQQFEVLAVPEPAVWAMLVFGIAAVLAACRRRKPHHPVS